MFRVVSRFINTGPLTVVPHLNAANNHPSCLSSQMFFEKDKCNTVMMTKWYSMEMGEEFVKSINTDNDLHHVFLIPDNTDDDE